MSEQAVIPVEIQEKINQELQAIVSGSSTITVIENNQQYENAVSLTKSVKKLLTDFESERDALVRPKNELVSAINAWFKRPAERLREVESGLKRVIMTYQDIIEQRRIEAQRVADELARKEREKIESAARAQR